MIDPDGEGGLAPFTAYCYMTDKKGVGVTVISHNSESMDMKTEAVTYVTFITQEQVCLSWRV